MPPRLPGGAEFRALIDPDILARWQQHIPAGPPTSFLGPGPFAPPTTPPPAQGGTPPVAVRPPDVARATDQSMLGQTPESLMQAILQAQQQPLFPTGFSRFAAGLAGMGAGLQGQPNPVLAQAQQARQGQMQQMLQQAQISISLGQLRQRQAEAEAKKLKPLADIYKSMLTHDDTRLMGLKGLQDLYPGIIPPDLMANLGTKRLKDTDLKFAVTMLEGGLSDAYILQQIPGLTLPALRSLEARKDDPEFSQFMGIKPPDVRAAEALERRKKQRQMPSQAVREMLPPGVNWWDADEKQLRVAREAAQARAFAEAREKARGAEIQKAEFANREKWIKFKAMANTMDRMQTTLIHDPGAFGAPGTITALTGDLTQAAKGVLSLFGGSWLPDVLDLETYAPYWAELGLKNRELQTQLLGVAFAAAAAQGLFKGRVSNFQVERVMEQMRPSRLNPIAFRQALAEFRRTMYDQLLVETQAIFGEEAKPPLAVSRFASPDEVGEAYRKKMISEEESRRILRERWGIK